MCNFYHKIFFLPAYHPASIATSGIGTSHLMTMTSSDISSVQNSLVNGLDSVQMSQMGVKLTNEVLNFISFFL